MLHRASRPPTRLFATTVLAVLLGAALAGCFHAREGAPAVYGMTTGSSAGVYFAIGNGIASAVNNASDVNYRLEVATSGGSAVNANRLAEGTHHLAMMQNDVAYYAAQGQDAFSGNAVTTLRAIASMYPEMIQIVTLKSANINSLQGLAGKQVVLGAAGSGAAVNAGQILNASGVSVDRQFIDLTTGLERLKDGQVDAVFWTGGVPTGAITSLATTHPVSIVPIPDSVKNSLRTSAPFYANATLPAGTYAGQDSAVNTVAVMAILVGRADLPNDHVQSLLGLIFDGTRVQQSHAQGANVKLDNAFVGVTGVTWHPGAVSYYQSKGLTVPS